MPAKKKRKYTMSPLAERQRHNAPLKHGKRSPLMNSLGKKFGCTKPGLHEGAEGEYDPENCVYCKARWDHLIEVRTLLGNLPANLMERAVMTRADLDMLREESAAEGTNPLRDKDYVKGLEMDFKLMQHMSSMNKGNTVNVVHHKAKDDEEDFTVIDVTRVEEQ